jgi:hypothetical protein
VSAGGGAPRLGRPPEDPVQNAWHAGQRVLADLRRRWAAFSVRGLLLYVLPLPLVPALLISLLREDYARVGGHAAGLVLLLGGAVLARRGLRAEAELRRRRAARPPRLPRKLLGGLLVAAGVAVTALLSIGHPWPVAAGLAAAAALGYGLAYGLDPRRERRAPAPVHGYSAEEIAQAVDEAERAIASIEAASRQIRGAELGLRLDRIAGLAHEVVGLIQDDPRDLRRARKFLNVYLKGAQQVSEGYARTQALRPGGELEDNFRRVLVTIEDVFAEQRDKLVENDALDLDVRIEVLEAQLRREGVG